MERNILLITSARDFPLRANKFVVNRLFMKLLKTSDINIVRTCQHMFGFELPSVLLDRRTRKFLEKKI